MSDPATDRGFDPVDAITEHSRGFAAAATQDVDAPVEHCPGWTVADLVEHLTQVQWSWATIADERLDAPPGPDARPPTAPREQLIATFERGADHLARVLRDADPATPVWTWAPGAQDITFITRHQVQEAAVHHWDAVHAVGGSLQIATPVAVDSVTEFLTYSVSSEADPAEPELPALAGRFTLRCSDADRGWTVSDGPIPGTVAFDTTVDRVVDRIIDPAVDPAGPAITATGSDLLLWLYGRVDLDTAAVDAGVLARFRALCFTT